MAQLIHKGGGTLFSEYHLREQGILCDVSEIWVQAGRSFSRCGIQVWAFPGLRFL